MSALFTLNAGVMSVFGPKRRFAASQRYVRSSGVKPTCQDSSTDATDRNVWSARA